MENRAHRDYAFSVAIAYLLGYIFAMVCMAVFLNTPAGEIVVEDVMQAVNSQTDYEEET